MTGTRNSVVYESPSGGRPLVTFFLFPLLLFSSRSLLLPLSLYSLGPLCSLCSLFLYAERGERVSESTDSRKLNRPRGGSVERERDGGLINEHANGTRNSRSVVQCAPRYSFAIFHGSLGKRVNALGNGPRLRDGDVCFHVS